MRKKSIIGIGCLLLATNMFATLLQDWQFNDATGTTLNNVSNSVSGGSAFSAVQSGAATDGAGNYVFSSGTTQAGSSISFSAVTTGSLFLRVDFAEWSLVSGNQALFYLQNGTNNIRLVFSRTAANGLRLQIWGTADETVNVNNIISLGDVSSTGLSAILEVNKDSNQWQVHYDAGSGWTNTAWYGVAEDLAINEFRFSKAGDFSGASTSLSIDRIMLATTFADVIPEPATLGMLMISVAGLMAFRRLKHN